MDFGKNKNPTPVPLLLVLRVKQPMNAFCSKAFAVLFHQSISLDNPITLTCQVQKLLGSHGKKRPGGTHILEGGLDAPCPGHS